MSIKSILTLAYVNLDFLDKYANRVMFSFQISHYKIHYSYEMIQFYTMIVFLIDINECISLPCQNNALCRDDVNSYLCQCSIGFVGVTCETGLTDWSVVLIAKRNVRCLGLYQLTSRKNGYCFIL